MQAPRGGGAWGGGRQRRAEPGARSPALGEPREGQPRVRGSSLPHCCVPASASPRVPGMGQLPAGPSPGVPRRGPGIVSPAAVGGRELVEGGRGFGVRGSAGGRGWETCPQPGLAEAERGGGVSLRPGPGVLGRGKG